MEMLNKLLMKAIPILRTRHNFIYKNNVRVAAIYHKGLDNHRSTMFMYVSMIPARSIARVSLSMSFVVMRCEKDTVLIREEHHIPTSNISFMVLSRPCVTKCTVIRIALGNALSSSSHGMMFVQSISQRFA